MSPHSIVSSQLYLIMQMNYNLQSIVVSMPSLFLDSYYVNYTSRKHIGWRKSRLTQGV